MSHSEHLTFQKNGSCSTN